MFALQSESAFNFSDLYCSKIQISYYFEKFLSD